MLKFLTTVGFEPGTFRLRRERTTTVTELQGLMYKKCMSSGKKFAWFYQSVLFLEIYLLHVVVVAK